MDNKNKDSQPADMHSDGVHFDKDILESKRNNSARSKKTENETSKSLKLKDGNSNKDSKTDS